MVDPTRQASLGDGRQVRILTVPYFHQRDCEPLCVPCSIKMILEYYKQYYPNPVINQHVPLLTIKEIMRLIGADSYNGTRITSDFLLKINAEIDILNFISKKNVKLKEIRKRLEDNVPSVLVYNNSFMNDKIPGPAHAGVIIGLTENEIVLNNPWEGQGTSFTMNDIVPAWELEKNSVLFIDPNPQSKLNDGTKKD